MVIFFNLCLILVVIFSKILKPNIAKMLREKQKKKMKKWEMKSKKEER